MTIYNVTGWGKGKTTSALGITARALANNECVLFCSFLKDGNDGALELFKTHFPITFKSIAQGTKGFTMDNCTNFYKECMDEIGRYDPDLVVFDELNVAIDNNLIDKPLSKILEDLTRVDNFCDVYVTGRINTHNKRHLLMEHSNIASNIKCENHYYNKRCPNCSQEYSNSFLYCPNCGHKLSVSYPAKKGREV